MRKNILIVALYLGFYILCLTGCNKIEKEDEQIEQEPPIVLTCDIVEALVGDRSNIKLSDTIYSSIVEEWEIWNSTDIEARALSGEMPGNKSMYFESWNEAVNYIGFIPWNPFENVDWLEKRNYVGTRGWQHCHFYVAGNADGELGFAYLSTGYALDEIRMILTDYIYTINFRDTPLDQYVQVKYYQLYKENDSIMIRECTEKDQDYNCMIGLMISERSYYSVFVKFYKKGELKYGIQVITAKDMGELEDPFDKVCEELSIPLKYDAVFQ